MENVLTVTVTTNNNTQHIIEWDGDEQSFKDAITYDTGTLFFQDKNDVYLMRKSVQSFKFKEKK